MAERGIGVRLGGMRRAVVLLSALCLSMAAGCVRNSDPETGAEPPEPTYLRVENRAFLDMTIYVYRSAQRIRLGQATGNSTTRFRIPSNLLFGATPMRFQADPIGGTRSPVSQEVTVSPGDEVMLIIPPS